MTPDALVAMAVQGLRLDPPPSEAEIEDILIRLAGAFSLADAAIAEARLQLHARLSIRMELGQTLKDEHVPWLAGRRAGIDPFYWSRYRQLLLRGGWPPLVVDTLDRSTDTLLDLLADPTAPGPSKRRGLVVGDVQSGKTASYAALICKAADAGYRMVILLAGTLENVRRQTQERLDASFVGLDSRDFLTRGQLRHQTYVGVGHLDSRRHGVVFTSRDNDFRRLTATALNITLDAVREPVLVVTKKNKRTLENLAGWLRARNADRRRNIDLPLLLVDDEADNASINTRLDPNETTAINRAIRDLLGLFTRSSYVGFTATPFANIFIDPRSTDEMLGDDLFPRDFIHLLEPPTNYIGMNALFGPTDPERYEDTEASSHAAGLRSIEDSDSWLPVAHRSEATPGPLPESLRAAVRLFLLTCAVRDLRTLADGPSGTHAHRSMLVNVSRFTAVQDRVATLVHGELNAIKEQVRLYGSLPPARAAAASAEIATLANLFARELGDCGVGWPAVLAVLHEAISPVVVQAVNQRTGARSLDYGATAGSPGIRVIAVGGNSLSRGLTLEGLAISYFLRNSRAYDTLLQMGRWFGYRPGYADLCRIWLTAEAEGWYRHVAEATNELKRDFARMQRQKATPQEFGLRVRTHPDTLLITARNKMATGVDVVGEVRDISLAGRGIETARLYADQRRNTENLRLVDRFLSVLGGGDAHGEDRSTARLWHDVPATQVADLLRDFLVHPMNHDFQGDAIAAFLEEAARQGDSQLATWTVALPTNGKGGPLDPALQCGIVVDAKERRVLLRSDPPQSLLVSGKGARVGGTTDVRYGLPPEEVAAIVEAERAARSGAEIIPEDVFRAAMRHPLLILYLLRGRERDSATGMERSYKGGLVLPALGLHFPGIRDLNGPRRYVSYRLNVVAQGELELDGDDIDVDAGED